MSIFLAFIGMLFAGGTIYFWRREATRAAAAEAKHSALVARFSGVVDADTEEARIRELTTKLSADTEANLLSMTAAAETQVIGLLGETDALSASYREKKEIYDRLLSEVAVFDERLSFAEMGVYEPHFEFTDSETYKEAIRAVRERQKIMVAAKSAVVCHTAWTVDGSSSKGQTMTNRNIRLTLRAFNNECEASIANVRWNNVNAMSKRITKAQEQINQLNTSNNTTVVDTYVKLRLEELFLTHEYREKLKAEREERAEAARLAREEQRLLRDLEEAQEREAHYQNLVDTAKADAAVVVGPQLDAYLTKINFLEAELAQARAKAERAQAMAEQTRSGYVYIISNIGSFGEGVMKIGLTRRLDPMDRVRELGDASVPFSFDTHAIIYSDDAPTLERALHGQFELTRINAQNTRKEFFRASIDEVEEAVRLLAPSAPFFKDIEAQEYRETLSRRRIALEQATTMEATIFPSEI